MMELSEKEERVTIGWHRRAISVASCLTVLMLATGIFATSLWAKTYKWVDGQGNVHFTDDINKIPPQFRTPDKTQNVREVVKTPAPPADTAKPAGDGKETKAKDAKGKEAGASGGEEGAAAGEGGKKTDTKALGLLQEAKDYLEYDNGEVRRILDSVPLDKLNAKQYIAHTQGINQQTKREMADKLMKSSMAELQKVGTFLDGSAKLDAEVSTEPEGFFERAVEVRARMEQELKQKESLIADLKAVLDKLGK